MRQSLPLIALLATSPALAQETRQLEAHEHGVGTLNIAIDGTTVAMEFMAPGADIVGFEYEATSAEDRAAVDGAVATLARPLDLFVVPAAAECTVTQAAAALEFEDDHDDHGDHGDHGDHAEHGHDDHAHDDHDHEGHAADKDHENHDHEEHAAHDDHDDHDHEEHAAHDDHDDHAEEATHTEFHAEYTLACANPDALTEITFAYFETFENALEVEVQIVTASGAQAFEVERDAPVLDLRSLF